MTRCIDTLGIGFLYAPVLHPAMKYAIGPRREIGIRTIFNILGPLTNPAGASRQLLGVFERDLTEPLARVLDNLGSMHALIVHGEDGLDEITITGKTYVSELKNGTITNFSIHPEDYGIAPRAIDRIRVQTIKENIACVDQVFNNSDHAKRDIVLLNAGAAIYVSGKASSIAKGIDQAREAINSGNARKVLTQLVEITK
jgi:anthranilate phosphoribosyltransferase